MVKKERNKNMTKEELANNKAQLDRIGDIANTKFLAECHKDNKDWIFQPPLDSFNRILFFFEEGLKELTTEETLSMLKQEVTGTLMAQLATDAKMKAISKLFFK